MTFAREVKRFLFSSQNGRLMLGNARSGERGGLYTRYQMVDYMTAAYETAIDPTASDRETINAFENAIRDLRMTPYIRGQRRRSTNANFA